MMSSCVLALALGTAMPARAQDAGTAAAAADADEEADDQPAPGSSAPIVVYGRGEKRIGEAVAASEGGVAGADLEVRPLLRPGELLEATPGLIATQHSGGGKANQFFLRGFNLDHGTDFAAYIDDMPVNFRTHGHGQGYLDVQGLIPETVSRIDYRKGPYRADTGDFSFVGATFITTQDHMRPFAVAELGEYGYSRYVAGGSVPLAGGDLLLVGQAKFNDGPWQLPEDFDGYSGFLKYSRALGDGQVQASLNVYHSSWAPTEQLPVRAVGTLVADRYGSLDLTLRGSTKREVATIGYRSDTWKATAYLQHYDWSLLNNFTFFLDDPINGDQRRQYEERWTYGGRAERTVELGDALSIRAGAEARVDQISPVGLDATREGSILYTYSAFDVSEKSIGVYAEAIWRPLDRLMVIAGVREDFYHFRTTPVAGALSWGGEVDDDTFAPKIGLNYEIADGIALYANYGQGFHSNDARGVTNPVSPAPGLIGGVFKEVGGRFERSGLILSAVYWWSEIESELIYVGDSGAVEPTDPGKRHGYELTGFYKPNGWLALDAVWTGSTARYVGLSEGQNFVPGALESSGEFGASAILPTFNAAARLRYLGPHALIEDNSERGEETLLVNLRAAWTPRDLLGLEVYGELLNALDSDADDIDYFYATRLPGEPADGIEGRNSRIVEPRQFRIGLKKTF
jgi:outer membrane receptor protein involved in Fe transport